MFKSLATITLALSFSFSFAQSSILWNKSYGGSYNEKAYSVIETLDGGLMTVGSANSLNGDVSSNYSYIDAWILKLDANGNIEWETSVPEYLEESARDVIQLADSSYMIAGKYTVDTFSFGNYWDDQMYVARINPSGSVLWTKNIGNSHSDAAYALAPNDQGGAVVVGYEGTTGWDEADDLMVVSLDSLGNIIWQQSYGGSYTEIGQDIIRTIDGGYAIVGSASSLDGDVSQSLGGLDIWLLKISNTGSLQWEKSLGGTSTDVAKAIIQMPNGDFVMSGETNSNDGDFFGNLGYQDIFILKTDSLGNTLWSNLFGTGYSEYGNGIALGNNNDYLVAGTYSTVANSYEAAIICVDSIGNFKWDKFLGSSGFDEAKSIIHTNDGGYAFAGYNNGNSVDVSGNHGGYDTWVVKFIDVTEVSEFEPIEARVYPNPARDIVTLDFNQLLLNPTVQLIDMQGRVCTSISKSSSYSMSFDTESLENGVYLVAVKDGNLSGYFRFVKH